MMIFLPRSDRRKFLKEEARHFFRRLNHDPDYRYVFHHIPKCAGTSARRAFEEWFVTVLDYHRPWADQNDPDYMRKYTQSPLNVNRLQPRHLLIGHYNLPKIRIGKRYPELFERDDFRLITFLRDPLELQLSLHYYEIREGMIDQDAPLIDRLLMRPNYLAGSLGCNKENWKEFISQYWFVGIAEHLQKSFNQLSKKLRKPPVQIPVLNTTKRQEFELGDAELEKFRELNELDYWIYEYCMNKYRNEFSVS